eukprot:919370-Rhodomonas_salina.1
MEHGGKKGEVSYPPTRYRATPCYEMSGTELGHATRCPVLSEGICCYQAGKKAAERLREMFEGVLQLHYGPTRSLRDVRGRQRHSVLPYRPTPSLRAAVGVSQSEVVYIGTANVLRVRLLTCNAWARRCPVLTYAMLLPGPTGLRREPLAAVGPLKGISLRARYALSGTERAYGTVCPRAMSGTKRASGAICLRARYALSGTERAYGNRSTGGGDGVNIGRRVATPL